AGSPIQLMKRGSTDRGRGRLTVRDLVLVTQIALCALLITSSLVAARGLWRALDGASAGIHPQGVLLASEDHPAERDPDRRGMEQKALIDVVRSIAGVTAVGAAREMPMSWPRRVTPIYRPENTERTPEHQALAAHVYPVSPEYLRAAGTRLLAG